MINRTCWIALVCGVVMLVGACGGSADEAPADQASAARPTPAEVSQAGTHCFAYQDQYLTLDVELSLDDEQKITGRQNGFNENKNEGYSVGYRSTITGVREGNTLNLIVTTEIENDVQEEQETWTWDEEAATLHTGRLTLQETPCDLAQDDPPAASPAPEAPPARTAHTSHCSPDEWAVFSCRIEDSPKVVSVCASEPLTRTEGYLQYRFGRPGAVELTYPEDRANTQDQFMWQNIGYSGGWDTRIQFSNGGYRFQLYDQAYKVSMSEKELHGGIIILDGAAVVAHLHCDASTLGPPYANTLNDLYERIPDGEFFDE